MPNWEVFAKAVGRAVSSRPIVGIQQRGQISLNRPAFEAIGQPTAVHLLFDYPEKLIGLQPTNPGPGTYAVRRQGATNSYVVSARGILFAVGYNPVIPRRFGAQMVNGVLTVDLKQDIAGVKVF